jgi:hypothetical protein
MLMAPNTPGIRQPQGSSAFTLIELLVASAVTSMLVVLLLAVSNNMLSHFNRVRGGTEYRLEAVRALDAIIADLETLIIPNDRTAEALRTETETVNDLRSPWLTFLASPVDRVGQSSSPVQAISYRLAWQDPVSHSGSAPRFGLYRKTAVGQQPFDSDLHVQNLHTDFWAARPTRDLDDLLANDIVAFQIHFQKRSDGKWISLPENNNPPFTIARAGTFYGSASIPGGISAVEVSLTVLSKQGANLLRDGSITLEDATRRFGETFTRRTSLLPREGP